MVGSDAERNFAVEVVEVDGRSVVAVRGEIDLLAVDALRDGIDRCRDSGRPLVLDLAEVTFMDSTGIKALVWAHRRQGRLQEAVVVRNPSAVVQRVLALAGLTDLFVVESTPEGPDGLDGDPV